jgi:hypothetical protein
MLKLVNGGKDDSRETMSDSDRDFIAQYKDLDIDGRNRLMWAMQEYMREKDRRENGYVAY